ncbi:MAG: TIGR04283 family arsenosugar biosynthesis glycosyltransferase [Planctomycetaceae bacterium]|nr:TIGR04283 family arsenosugar biosynthesis glycosyltransferase [Planctomycetaceae bacterium]
MPTSTDAEAQQEQQPAAAQREKQSGVHTSAGCKSDQRIIVMARCPEAGKAKTRLIPALGAAGAAELHSCLVLRTLVVVRRFAQQSGCDIDVHFAGGSSHKMQRLFGDDLQYSPQQGESLGERIHHAISLAFTDGFRRVVVIGTDCPQLEDSHLHNAFASLADFDVTIGPAFDGGYYLIGMRAPTPELFEDISWGTETVLAETSRNLQRAEKSVTLLTRLSDVDLPEDLILCRQHPQEFAAALPHTKIGLLSIIIPVLNEEAELPERLQPLTTLRHVEVIIVDGGSTDATCRIAEEYGAKVIRCGKGRGRQMNTGAAMARGEVLLFLHADTRLPPDFYSTVWQYVESRYSAGAFRLRIDDPRWTYRLVEFGANLRSHWRQLPYGDQALFVRSEVFYEMNGFRTWPLLEDLDFAQRLRRRGRIMIASSSATVSARRWRRIGILKATLINQIVIIAYRLGVSPSRLAALYNSDEGKH